MPQKTATRVGSKDDEVTEAETHDDMGGYLEPKALVKPENQLKLTEAELKEEFTRVLTGNSPHAPDNPVRWSFKESQYKVVTNIEHLEILYTLDSNMVHVDSDEAKKLLALQGDASASVSSMASPVPSKLEVTETETKKAGGEVEEEEEEEGEEEGEEETVEQHKEPEAEADEDAPPADSGKKPRGGKEKKLTNQFNFSERASQTYNNPMRDRSTITDPPPKGTYSGNVSQWEIYDAYQEDYAKQQQEKEKEKKKPTKKEESKKKTATTGDSQTENVISLIAPAVKILERMVGQNNFDEISQDYRYYEDPSDEFRDQEGTLLPLWQFSFELAKRLAITYLCWSPKYIDLFAVAHGSYDFLKQYEGLLLFYTLKNPSYPEYILPTRSGVMSLDFHPIYPYLIALGFYDGNVGVYNVMENTKQLSYQSSAKSGQHSDPVWEVRWQPEDLDGNLNFYSVSSDGRVVAWTLLKNDLLYQDVINLMIDGLSTDGPDGTKLITLGSGLTFDFHPVRDHIFVIGTQEGKVHVCSKYYSSAYLDTYLAHHLAVYRIQWNYYHPNVFITCSADWTIKIWDLTTDTREPLYTFDVGSSVGDVAWAPYSSTVFAAVTTDGKVFVFDINVNKFEPLCEQMVALKKKTKLTRIAFNPKLPVITVGDDRGSIISLKLSPNLRKHPKEKKGQEVLKGDDKEMRRLDNEYQKLEKLLVMVRPTTTKGKNSMPRAAAKEGGGKQDEAKND